MLLQVCYAIMIGFMYTIIVYKGGSLWPCIASHMFVNGCSVFALEQGPFSNLVEAVFGQASFDYEKRNPPAQLVEVKSVYIVGSNSQMTTTLSSPPSMSFATTK